MIFSKACEYAIKASIFVARRSNDGQRSNLKEISAAIESPEAFTAKILQQLVKHDIISSIKGAHGGFEVEVKRIPKIKLLDIVIAIDGEINEKQCALGLRGCSQKNPCPLHDQFKFIRGSVLSMLQTTSLQKLSVDLKEGVTVLKH
jgi:Rrf2 family protein